MIGSTTSHRSCKYCAFVGSVRANGSIVVYLFAAVSDTLVCSQGHAFTLLSVDWFLAACTSLDHSKYNQRSLSWIYTKRCEQLDFFLNGKDFKWPGLQAHYFFFLKRVIHALCIG
jgi:hypothetical protein